jgi:hypothetical protein
MFDDIFSVFALLLGLVALWVAALRFGVDSRTPVLVSDPYRRDL